MEIKKIIVFILIAVLFPLSLLFFSDITQYRKIGDTHFYLLEGPMGDGAYLYHSGRFQNPSYPIYHDGVVCDVFWNNKYIIIKTSKSGNVPIEHWYILRNLENYQYKEFEIKHFLEEERYITALDSIGLIEKKYGTYRWYNSLEFASVVNMDMA